MLVNRHKIKKVAHVIPAFYPVKGGIETLLTLLHPRLQSDYGIQSVAFAPQFGITQAENEDFDGLRTNLIPIPGDAQKFSSPSVIASYFALIRKRLELEAPDLIHLHGPYALFHMVPNVARSMGIPLIHHIHGELPDNLDKSTLTELSKAHWTIAVSNSVAQSIKSHFPTSTPIVIPNGIEKLDPIEPSQARDEFLISLVGRMDSNKGFDYALKAISIIKKRGIKVNIQIVGIGDLIHIQSLLSRFDLENETFFFGRCTREKTLEIMRRSSVLVASSIKTEGFSLVAAEAGGMGLPVVAFATGGLMETVVDGITGTIVQNRDVKELAKALERYARDQILCKKHGESAIKHVRHHYSIDSFTSRIVDIYQAATLGK